MSETSEKKGLGRRDFMRRLGVGAGAVGLTAATVAASGGKEAQAKTPETGKKSTGYRETEHVRQAYKAARF